jgi:hypothetical protein
VFKLGEKVKVDGRFVKVDVTRDEVSEMESIVRSGFETTSNKYETRLFKEAKEGIVVGVRSVVDYREHSLQESGECIETKTTRRKVYLVACDLRGIYKVPADLIESIDIDVLLEDDFDDFEFDELEEELLA